MMHKSDVVMLGNRPAEGRQQPIGSCPKCRRLVRIRENAFIEPGTFDDFEYEAIRVLLQPTGIKQEFAVKSDSGHLCTGGFELADSSTSEQMITLRMPDDFNVDVYLERESSDGSKPEHRHATLRFVCPAMTMVICRMPAEQLRELGVFFKSYAKLLKGKDGSDE